MSQVSDTWNWKNPDIILINLSNQNLFIECPLDIKNYTKSYNEWKQDWFLKIELIFPYFIYIMILEMQYLLFRWLP